MKNRIILIALTLMMGVMINSCKKTKVTPKTEEELQIEKLALVWVPKAGTGAITIDGVDVSTDWANFVLTVTDKAYQTTGSFSTEVWPASGSWAFGADVNTLVRDGIDVSIAVTDTALRLEFDYTVGGRLEAIEGKWIFNMVPQ